MKSPFMSHGKSKKKPYPTLQVSPEDYGAVGDGVTNDNAAFQAMHDAIIAAQDAKPGLRVTMNFAKDADYLYTDTTWSWGIEYLTINGNNASITNINTGPTWGDVIWQTNNPSFPTSGPDQLGYTIDTALQGTSSVTLKDVANTSEFEVGKWALVASYSQQSWGWPPNARNFDFAKVTDIDGATITLDRPLQDTHRDNFPSRGGVDEVDVARIIPAEREVDWAESWLIRDLRVLPNPNWSGGGMVQIESFNKLVFDNVDIFNYSAGQGIDLVFRNSRLPSAEPDKVLETLTIENSEANLIFNGTGIETFNFISSESDQFYFAGRNLNIEGSTFNHAGPERQYDPITTGGPWSLESVTITDTVFNGQNVAVQPIMKGGWILRTEIGAGYLALDGDDLVVTDPIYFDIGYMHDRVYEGQYLLLEDASQNPLGYGQVQTITSNGGPLTARLDVDWSITPQTGMFLVQHNTAKMVGSDITLNDTFFDPVRVSDTAYVEWEGVVHYDPLWPV